jgi:hypothetical protein
MLFRDRVKGSDIEILGLLIISETRPKDTKNTSGDPDGVSLFVTSHHTPKRPTSKMGLAVLALQDY